MRGTFAGALTLKLKSINFYALRKLAMRLNPYIFCNAVACPMRHTSRVVVKSKYQARAVMRFYFNCAQTCTKKRINLFVCTPRLAVAVAVDASSSLSLSSTSVQQNVKCEILRTAASDDIKTKRTRALALRLRQTPDSVWSSPSAIWRARFRTGCRVPAAAAVLTQAN